MSELQDALDYWDGRTTHTPPDHAAMDVIVDAARGVANPDYEAAAEQIWGLRYVNDEDEWDGTVKDIARLAVDAALLPKESS